MASYILGGGVHRPGGWVKFGLTRTGGCAGTWWHPFILLCAAGQRPAAAHAPSEEGAYRF
jgi:hypothetical protein